MRRLRLLALLLGGCSSNDQDFENALTEAAEGVGLDLDAWNACRHSDAASVRVDNDIALGHSAGVRGTPAFALNGEVLGGVQPLEALQREADAARAEAQRSGNARDSYYGATYPKLPVGDSPVRGTADAWVTVLEFGDFQCPYCREAKPIMDDLLEANPKDVRLVFKHFPLDMHAHARPAAIAAECASQQGKFWPFHDTLYENQRSIFAE